MECDSDPHGTVTSAPYQWQDLLNPDLPLMGFEAVLISVLQSGAEMEKIKGLNEQEFQRAVDVLGQVLLLSIQFPPFSYLLMPRLSVLGNRGCDGRAPEDLL